MAVAVVLLCCTCIFPFPPTHQFPSRGNRLIYFLYYRGCKLSPSYPQISIRPQILSCTGHYLGPVTLCRTHNMPCSFGGVRYPQKQFRPKHNIVFICVVFTQTTGSSCMLLWTIVISLQGFSLPWMIQIMAERHRVEWGPCELFLRN